MFGLFVAIITGIILLLNGWIDDIAVLNLVLLGINEDLKRYEQWRLSRGLPT